MKDPPAAAGVKLGFLTAWILENGFILAIAWLMSLALAIYDDPTHSVSRSGLLSTCDVHPQK